MTPRRAFGLKLARLLAMRRVACNAISCLAAGGCVSACVERGDESAADTIWVAMHADGYEIRRTT